MAGNSGQSEGRFRTHGKRKGHLHSLYRVERRSGENVMHDVAIKLIRRHLETDLALDGYYLSNIHFKERSYIRWAFYEIIGMLCEYSDLFFVPEHISGQRRKGVFEIFDDFIAKMEYFLSLRYTWGFDVAKHAAIQFKVYLKNTGLFEEEVALSDEE